MLRSGSNRVLPIVIDDAARQSPREGEGGGREENREGRRKLRREEMGEGGNDREGGREGCWRGRKKSRGRRTSSRLPKAPLACAMKASAAQRDRASPKEAPLAQVISWT